MTSTHGMALRHIGGEGPVEVVLRTDDFNLQTMKNDAGREMEVPIRSLIAFSSMKYRELGGDRESDMWEFQVPSPVPGGGSIVKFVYINGADILMLSAPSKVAL